MNDCKLIGGEYMSVKIKFKTGEGIPNKLEVGEPAFDTKYNIVYIGDQNGNPISLNSVNTDKITQGDLILILNGGTSENE